MKFRIKQVAISVTAVVVAAIGGVMACDPKPAHMQVETVKAEKGTLSNEVTATGTIEAIKTVTVGTQVSGTIEAIYVDFNSVVKKGQLLAKIDETTLRAQVNQTAAQMASAKAERVYQQANFDRVKALYDKQLVSKADFDQAQYGLSKADASYKMAESEHQRSLTNLSYASIYSPIDGVVLNRAVDEGQTVAASFNTPELFAIANDLTQMEVQADVDEADIGQVKLGQKVNFTVDAFPDDSFNGEVSEIWLKPTTISNVVTYTVIISAPNPMLKLMPGMTANITIVTQQAENVVMVPARALKFWPDDSLIAGNQNRSRLADTGNLRTLWQFDGFVFTPLEVTTGITDGASIQIIDGLKEGDEVVVDAVAGSSSAKSSSSPFMPRPPSRNTKSKTAEPPRS